MNGKFITTLAKLHYQSRYNPPIKVFDFYVAFALVCFLKSIDLRGLPWRRMFYNDKYGLTLVSECDIWEAAMESYVSRIDVRPVVGENEFNLTKKKYFRKEIEEMRTIDTLPYLEVCWSV